MSKQPDAEKMERLVLVKYLHSLGVEQSRQPRVQAVSALLTFHDAVELFFQIAADHLGIQKKIEHFMDYWTEINEQLKKQDKALTDRTAIDKLNRARVDLKHHAIFTYDYGDFRASITNFFSGNTPTIFGINFDDISMLNLVSFADARDKLEEASKLLHDSGSIEEAMQMIVEAFDLLLEDYAERRNSTDGYDSFPFGRSLLMATSSRGVTGVLEAQSIAEIVDALRQMQESVKLIFIGQDLRKYAKFKRLLPPHIRAASGEFVWDDLSHLPNARPRTKEDAQFCFDFVIDTAIRLQEFDYEEEHSGTGKPDSKP